MKKLIYIIGIIFLLIIIILNLVFTATLSMQENINITVNHWIYNISIIALGLLIYSFTEYSNKYLQNKNTKEKTRKHLLYGAIIIYAVSSILWVVLVNPKIVGDSVHVCNFAQTIYRGTTQDFFYNDTYLGTSLGNYMEIYHQQISLAFIYSLFFRITYFDMIELLRILNVIGNIFIVIGIYKIGNHLSKEYKTNKVRLMFLILTFASLPMLATYVYGDIPSLALCIWSVYFMMKYTESDKTKYAVYASILMMIAYMMRMNSLIFIIATTIYLLLNLFKKFMKDTTKKKLTSSLVIIAYIVISIIPSVLIQNYYLDKFNLDKNKSCPTSSYILMGMEEGNRANGWYSEKLAVPALLNPEEKGKEYRDKVKQRLQYFVQNPDYAFNFYIMKVSSMWTENTYSAVLYNKSAENSFIENTIKPLEYYQKILLLITCISCLMVLIQNRKNISINIIFLITIFIGGFAFHILWEAKSRYIIPYIIVLIPLAGICINTKKLKSKNK